MLLVERLTGNETIIMQSENNFFLRIPASSVPEKKKSAVGVRGMKLGGEDTLTAVYLLGEEESRSGKEVALHRLRTGSRDTRGTKRA